MLMDLEKYSVLQLKLFTDLLENHPYSFLPVLKDALQFICWLCFTVDGSALVFQRLVIFCLNILKQAILCAEYRAPKHSQGNMGIRHYVTLQLNCFHINFPIRGI